MVIDLRSLNPLDFDTIADSVRKTGRVVIMHEGPRTLGFGAELAPESPKNCSTTWRHRCCEPRDSIRRIRRPAGEAVVTGR